MVTHVNFVWHDMAKILPDENFSLGSRVGVYVIMKTMGYYIKGYILRQLWIIVLRHYCLLLLCYYFMVLWISPAMEFMIIYMLLVQLFYVVSSDTPNSKLKNTVTVLEKAILKESPCLNCTLEVRIRYLELFAEKFSAVDLADQSMNWSNKFAFGLASAVTAFGFNLVVAVFGICYTHQSNKKFKKMGEGRGTEISTKIRKNAVPSHCGSWKCNAPGEMVGIIILFIHLFYYYYY